jgi:hypothetical protein
MELAELIERHVGPFGHDGGVEVVDADRFTRSDRVGTEPELRGANPEPPGDLGAREAFDEERGDFLAGGLRADAAAERRHAASMVCAQRRSIARFGRATLHAATPALVRAPRPVVRSHIFLWW